MNLLEDLKKMREEIEISINNNKELLKSYESEYYQCKALLEVQTKEYNRLRKLIREYDENDGEDQLDASGIA